MNKFSEADRIEQFEKLMNPLCFKRIQELADCQWIFHSPGFYSSPRGIYRGVVRS